MREPSLTISTGNLRKRSKIRATLYRAARIFADVADVLVHVRSGSGWLGVASLSMKAAGAIVEHTRHSPYDYFAGWRQLALPAFDSQLYKLATVHGHATQPVGTERVVLVELGGVTLGWIDNGDDLTGPFVRSIDEEEPAMRALADIVWASTGSNWCVLDTILDDNGNVVPTFSADDLVDAPPSALGDRVIAREQQLLAKGYTRSVLFYGPPGTGKSCAMRYVAKNLSKRVFRISVQTLGDEKSRDAIVPAVRLLRPDTLLVDDFDRLGDEWSFLYEIERLRHHIKLFLASANRIRWLDEAILRHGRFDDLVPVTVLDEKAADAMIGDKADKRTRTRLRKLPASALEEFRRLRKTFGTKEAVKEINSLTRKAKKLQDEIDGPKKRRKRKKEMVKKVARSEALSGPELLPGQAVNDAAGES